MSRKQFEDVSCKYGAPMGRGEVLSDLYLNLPVKARCFKVKFVDGDYDDGGCYFGGYPSQPLYCSTKQKGIISDGNGLLLFTRATNRKSAKENFQEKAKKFGCKITWIN
jgi:hypothetical protein